MDKFNFDIRVKVKHLKISDFHEESEDFGIMILDVPKDGQLKEIAYDIVALKNDNKSIAKGIAKKVYEMIENAYYDRGIRYESCNGI